LEISDAMIDAWLKECENPEDILGNDGLLRKLSTRILERALAGEMDDHLGYRKHEAKGRNSGNSRNGGYGKTLKSKNGEIRIDVPRDRDGSFEPQLVKKGQRRFDGFNEKILSLYARGLTTRDIQAHLEEIYGVEISPSLISNVTNEVMDEVKEWQNRPLDEIYPIVFFDAMRVKIRSQEGVINKAAYHCLAVDMDGKKDLLGLWIQENEGAKFWLAIFNQLRNRGVKDIFIACVDGLKGMPEAIEAAFPETKIQLCIVHMVRNSLNFTSWKDRKAVARDLKAIYASTTSELAEKNLDQFSQRWDEKYPTISKSWRKHWNEVSTFFAYPPSIRKVIYTTNAVESVNRSIRKIIKNRSIFPSDEAFRKIHYLSIKNVQKKWNMPVQHWKQALNQFAVIFSDRLPHF